MRLVVTGAAGFIGSNLVDRLLAEGHSVLAVDDLSSGDLANLAAVSDEPRLAFLPGDVAVTPTRAAMASFSADVFIHLAGQADVRTSVIDPIGCARRNVLGTLSALESARESCARKVVFASSGGTLYGEQEHLPVDESARPDPHSPYGASVLSGEQYLRAYHHLYRLQMTCLALGNVYGPRQDPRGPAGAVAIFAAAMLAGRPAAIFGDGEATRDYVYVDDVVEAFVRATGPAADGMRLNVGTGQETSVSHLYRLIAAAVGRSDPPVMRSARPGDLRRVALDSAAAHRVLGWRARTALPDGLVRTIGWIRDRVGAGAGQR
jgi:UDP-glucose 4-epimerase